MAPRNTPAPAPNDDEQTAADAVKASTDAFAQSGDKAAATVGQVTADNDAPATPAEDPQAAAEEPAAPDVVASEEATPNDPPPITGGDLKPIDAAAHYAEQADARVVDYDALLGSKEG
ncbi:MAG: hypothetical protein AAGC46_19455 [Solirubrobacteraceae bacterium]